MSKSGPEGPAMAVVKGKVKEVLQGNANETDFDPGDRLRKGEDLHPFARPQAQERMTAVLDPEPHSGKETGEMPQEAKEALNSDNVYSSNLPKRH